VVEKVVEVREADQSKGAGGIAPQNL